ncbi:MAG: tRNA (adenosine(37)-N6)-threonylcarbamoyltransferase complex transferase subunit TsaD [Patescibacteria group bacterium]|nr:tRNA (adenosine(37)-N6)-threonylcarbamoyltransferase complex transferase subunit TsaD [Patescibacteria group bacterium]MCL5093700.1 tRNA (adenosine(37)-N6)-threonylcarbamoyltransferase complex transferase subunit TsaD [Patescibacteria group bacterium]
MKSVKILAIETSCDETAAAISKNNQILSSVVTSQIETHKGYGGVVPELAARMHIEAIIPVIDKALRDAKTNWDEIDAIAVTQGPGLLGSLLIGVNTAKSLAYLKKKPIIAINHIEGHIYANFIREIPNSKFQIPKFPLIALVVSGGHTSLIYMKDHLTYKVVGQTIDDAAGEAFDKVAKVLGLGYPGGPIISKLAEKGNEKAFDFPRIDLTPPPQRDDRGYLVQPTPSLNFSFSGLKTAVINEVRKLSISDKRSATQLRPSDSAGRVSDKLKADVCASFQKAVIDVLIRNSATAIKMYKPKSFLLSGGVAANLELKKQLKGYLAKEKVKFCVPEPALCTDNAAMIAVAGYWHYLKRDFTVADALEADPNIKL